MDYRLGSGWSLFGRYTQDHWSQPFPSTLGFWGDDPYPSVESSWIQPGYQATIKLTKLFGSTAVNDFQISYAANRITANRSGTNPGLNDAITAAIRKIPRRAARQRDSSLLLGRLIRMFR